MTINRVLVPLGLCLWTASGALAQTAPPATPAEGSSLDLTLDTGAAEPPAAAGPSRARRGPALASRSATLRSDLRRPPAPAPSRVLARVATVVVSRAEIRLTASPGSRLLSVAGQGINLAVLSETATHFGVLMVNNSLGWVSRRDVQLIDYQTEVTLTNEPAPPALGNLDVAGMEPRTRTLLQEALSYLGVRYVWAGNSRAGLDCSGFVRNVFQSVGVALPRHSGDQAQIGQSVNWVDLRPGDRLYFAMKGGRVNHCGIYIGGGYFIHASSNHGQVAVDPINRPNYARALVCARRS